MSLLDYQIQIGSVLLGPGTDYLIHEVNGLGVQDVRTNDEARPLRHGDFLGVDTRSSRSIVLSITVRGDTSEATVANYDALMAVWSAMPGTDPTSLSFKLPGREEMYVLGKPRRVATDNLARIIGRRITATLEFYCPDPTLYSGTEQTLTANLGTITGGRAFPVTFPATFGTGTSGIITAVNAGNSEVWPLVRFHAPNGSTNPSIENITTGQKVKLATVLAAGDFYELDMDARSVLKNGSASRRSEMTTDSEWWPLLPGTSSIRYSADAGTGSFAEIIFRSGYVG